MDKVYRVFFHELGHFVARQINFLNYNGPKPIEIKIYPAIGHPGDYDGHTKPKCPEGFIPEGPIPFERIPSYLLSCIYGCIFQCYFKESSLKECFSIYGKTDMEKFTGALQGHRIYDIEGFKLLNSDLFKNIVINGSLEIFRQLEPDSYLQAEEDGRFSVDLDKLNKDIEPLLRQHFSLYKSFEERYSKAVNAKP